VGVQFQYDNLLRLAEHYKSTTERLMQKLETQKSVLLRARDELLEARELKKLVPPAVWKLLLTGCQ
jgi:hypothetical protein